MRIHTLQLSELRIPFTSTFRHAAAERSETSSVWVEADCGRSIGFGEACPRPYVTGETVESARVFFDRHAASLRADVVDLDSLRQWMADRAGEIDANPAAWCAVELALLDAIAKASDQTVEALLSLAPLAGAFQYTAVLGDAGDAAFAKTAEGYRRMGFSDFKLKISGDVHRDRGRIALLQSWGLQNLRVRVDSNNLWRDAGVARAYLESLGCHFFGVEEPLEAGRYADLSELARALDCRVILDESFVALEQMRMVERTPHDWIVNVRVSKMGGLLRSLAVVSAARARGVSVIVGAQVGETSLLTRAAICVAQAAGSALAAQEGAFGTFLLTRDVCEPPLMFGAGGVLDVARFPDLQRPGWGLAIARPGQPPPD